MANRYYNNQAFTLEPAIVKIFAKVTFAGASAPTLSTTDSKGVVSCTRNNTGLYTFVFGTQTGMLDVYNKLKTVSVMFDESGNSGTAPAAPLMYINANSVATAGTCSLQVQFTDKGQVAADPANTEIGYFEFTLKNSNAP